MREEEQRTDGDVPTGYICAETGKPFTRAELTALAYKEPSWKRELEWSQPYILLTEGAYEERLKQEGSVHGGVTTKADPLHVHHFIQNSPEFENSLKRAPDPDKWKNDPPLNTYGATEREEELLELLFDDPAVDEEEE